MERRLIMQPLVTTALAALLASAIGCGDKPPAGRGAADPADPRAPEAPEPPGPATVEPDDAEALAAAERRAFEAARPAFETHCSRCHTRGGAKSQPEALEHVAMDSYPFTGAHTADLGVQIREVLGAGGGEATMPKDDPGAVRGAELERIVEWTVAYDRAHEAGAGHHGEHQEGVEQGDGGHDHDAHDH
jgi:mono/diheme cytochrome c family protein